MGWNAKYALLIAFSTVATYISSLVIDKLEVKRQALSAQAADSIPESKIKKLQSSKKLTVALCLLVNLGILFVFKYFDFFLENINAVLSVFNISVIESGFSLILPVGISFYTFQALSYTLDVYRGTIRAEKNLVKYALFVSFFPQLVAGPIERSGNLLSQINNIHNIKLFDYKRISNGLIVMLWGFFLKMVIADRISTLADLALSHDTLWTADSTAIFVGIIAFSLQIYCDFSSYSTIAIGAAEVLGFSLMENFNTPYFSLSIKEFWNRWHISLSSWFKDYLYIPLGGNKKGVSRKYLNLLIVFLVSGLWHGASWTFVIWGLIHALYQIIGDITRKPKASLMQKLNVKTDSISFRLMKMATTFSLVNFAWIFFRAESISDAFTIISRLFTRLDPWSITTGGIYKLGLSVREMNILFTALLIMAVFDFIKYKKNLRIDAFLNTQILPFRWAVIILLLIFVIVFGIYGPAFDAQNFIYFQF